MKNKIFKRLYQWLTDIPKNKNRSSVIWNAAGGMFNAGQAAILLAFIAHKMDLVTAGIVTIAYAVANLFLSVCKYGIRNYQVTDVRERFSFSDYLYSRYITLAGTFILLTFYLAYKYLFGGYSLEKAAIFFEVATLKLIDAFEDVYIGRYQQVGRFDTGAKIMALRLIVSTALICILISAGTGIHISFLGGIILSLFFDIQVIKKTFFVTQTTFTKKQRNKILDLLKRCLPLCIGITLSTYIGNVPKYMIDAYMTEEIQAGTASTLLAVSCGPFWLSGGICCPSPWRWSLCSGILFECADYHDPQAELYCIRLCRCLHFSSFDRRVFCEDMGDSGSSCTLSGFKYYTGHLVFHCFRLRDKTGQFLLPQDLTI